MSELYLKLIRQLYLFIYLFIHLSLADVNRCDTLIGKYSKSIRLDTHLVCLIRIPVIVEIPIFAQRNCQVG